MLAPDVLAAFTTMWASAYAFVGAHYLIDYARRRERAHLSFGLLAMALSAFSAGSALLIDATTVEQATLGAGLKLGTALLGISLLGIFCGALEPGPRTRFRYAEYGAPAVGLLALTVGWVFEDRADPIRATFRWLGAPDYHEPAVTDLGGIIIAGGWLLAAHSVLRLVRTQASKTDGALIRVACVVNLAAGGHDTLVFIGALQSHYLLEHSALLFVAAMSNLFVLRATNLHDELATQEKVLAKSDALLRATDASYPQGNAEMALGELSGMIASEIRLPLRAIRRTAKGLRQEPSPDLLESLDGSIGRLNAVVSDLLAYARPISLQQQSMSLENAFLRAAQQLQNDVGTPIVVELKGDVAAQATDVYADLNLLSRALVHLLRNQAATWRTDTLVVRMSRVPSDGGDWVAADIVPLESPGDTNGEKPREVIGRALGRAVVVRVLDAHGGRVETQHGALRVVLPSAGGAHVAN